MVPRHITTSRSQASKDNAPSRITKNVNVPPSTTRK